MMLSLLKEGAERDARREAAARIISTPRSWFSHEIGYVHQNLSGNARLGHTVAAEG